MQTQNATFDLKPKALHTNIVMEITPHAKANEVFCAANSQ